MALIKCPECGNKISDSAGNCPNCGFLLAPEAIAEIRRKNEQAEKAGNIGCLSIVAFLAVVVVAVYISSNRGNSISEATQAAAYSKRVGLDDASMLCKAMKGTRGTTECSVNVSDSVIDVTIDTTGAEARKICSRTAGLMATETENIADLRSWTLRIYSPYSGNRPIATCLLVW
ncbi:MAG: zinc ribbon domain-containing protein [Rhodocyclaceae bacterium]|nr:zinc ribbon domain-containing protein [Rhodocyclaceae bacterium]